MVLSELPEDFNPEQFMQLDRPSLDQVPYERKKWLCECKGCEGGTQVRDYGISPYFFLDRNSKKSQVKPRAYWYKLTTWYWLCSKHTKFFKRLEKNYPSRDIEKKLFGKRTIDQKVISIPPAKNKTDARS